MLDTPSYSYNKGRHETLLLELLGKCGWELQLNLFYIYNLILLNILKIFVILGNFIIELE